MSKNNRTASSHNGDNKITTTYDNSKQSDQYTKGRDDKADDDKGGDKKKS